jgi:hypothetical protein
MEKHLAPGQVAPPPPDEGTDRVIEPLPPDEGPDKVVAPLPPDEGADAPVAPRRRPPTEPERPGHPTLDEDIIAERDPHATPLAWRRDGPR